MGGAMRPCPLAFGIQHERCDDASMPSIINQPTKDLVEFPNEP